MHPMVTTKWLMTRMMSSRSRGMKRTSISNPSAVAGSEEIVYYCCVLRSTLIFRIRLPSMSTMVNL